MADADPFRVGRQDERLRLLVCGGRDYDDRARMFAELDAIHAQRPITLIIQGGQKQRRGDDWIGADYLAEQWAEAREIPCLRHPARWTALGRPAGPIRNREMLHWAPEAVLAAPGGSGTSSMCVVATVAGIWIERFG
jgi:hypothetical protein